MKKLVRLFVVLLSVAMFLTSCSGGSDTPSSSDGSNNNTGQSQTDDVSSVYVLSDFKRVDEKLQCTILNTTDEVLYLDQFMNSQLNTLRMFILLAYDENEEFLGDIASYSNPKDIKAGDTAVLTWSLNQHSGFNLSDPDMVKWGKVVYFEGYADQSAGDEYTSDNWVIDIGSIGLSSSEASSSEQAASAAKNDSDSEEQSTSKRDESMSEDEYKKRREELRAYVQQLAIDKNMQGLAKIEYDCAALAFAYGDDRGAVKDLIVYATFLADTDNNRKVELIISALSDLLSNDDERLVKNLEDLKGYFLPQSGRVQSVIDSINNGTWQADSDGAEQQSVPSANDNESNQDPQLFTGLGEMLLDDGSTYYGEIVDDSPASSRGYGTRTWPNGDRYEGELADGLMDGNGSLTFANGNSYSGEYVKGLMEGQGTFIYANGDIYIGEYVKDFMEGNGTVTYADGGQYRGSFQKDVFWGEGQYFWNGHVFFIGEWRDGEAVGEGKYVEYDKTYRANIVDGNINIIEPWQD